MKLSDFVLADHHDVAALAETYAREGAVRVEKLFPDEIAQNIANILETQTPWRMVHSNLDGAHKVYTPQEWQALSQMQQKQIVKDTLMQARDGFAYLYSCFPMIDAYLAGENPDWPLHAMSEFLNTPQMHNFVKTITNEPSVKKLDCQATLYGRGHFLNTHDDTGTDAERRAAYVMGFSKDWHIDWGGQLLFLDHAGDIERGFNPSFNSLTLFKTPRPHIVTQVTNFAGRGRYSITGWLRDDL